MVSAKKEDLLVEQQKLAMHPDLLAAMEKEYRAKEKHSAEMGNINVSNMIVFFRCRLGLCCSSLLETLQLFCVCCCLCLPLHS